MAAVLICGDTLRSPEMRHEVPLGIGDQFIYMEDNGRRAVLTNVLEVDRIAQEAPELERLLGEQFGRDELIAQGLSYSELDRELFVRAITSFGISEAIVPPDFPLAVADRLRAEGIALTVDEQEFAIPDGPAEVNLVPGGSTAQAAGRSQSSSYTSSAIGRRRTAPCFPVGRPSVTVPAMNTFSGMANSSRNWASTMKLNPVNAPPYPSARAASSRFCTAG